MPNFLINVIVFIIFLILGIRFRKIFDTIIYYIFPIILTVYCIISPTRDLFILLGALSKQLLIFLLFIKPIAYIFSSKTLFKITSYRKQLGLMTFWFFLMHMFGLIILYDMYDIYGYFNIKILSGLLSGLGLFILAITSNNYSIKLLAKNWKRLHYIAYPVLFGVLIHASLAEDNNLNQLIIMGALFTVLKILEWNKIHFKKPSND